MLLQGWFAWMLLGYAIGGVFTGIIMVAVVGSLYSAKTLYRVQGDAKIKEGYIRDETDALIKIGSRAQSIGVLRKGEPPLPDDAQWFEKGKVELIRVLNKRKVAGQTREQEQPERKTQPFKPVLLKSVRDILAGISIMGAGFILCRVAVGYFATLETPTFGETVSPALIFIIGMFWGMYSILKGGLRIVKWLDKGSKS